MEPEIVCHGLDDSMWMLIEQCWEQDAKHRLNAAILASRLYAMQQMGLADTSCMMRFSV
jgi:hypothetical protein